MEAKNVADNDFLTSFLRLAKASYSGVENDLCRLACKFLIPEGGELRIPVEIVRIRDTNTPWLAKELDKVSSEKVFLPLALELALLSAKKHTNQPRDDENLTCSWPKVPADVVNGGASLVPLALVTALKNTGSRFYHPPSYSHNLADPWAADGLRALLILGSCDWNGPLPHPPLEAMAEAVIDVQPTKEKWKELRHHPLRPWFARTRAAQNNLPQLIEVLSQDIDLVRKYDEKLASAISEYFIPLLLRIQTPGTDEQPVPIQAVNPDPIVPVDAGPPEATPKITPRRRTSRSSVRKTRIQVRGREPLLPAESPDEVTTPRVAVRRKQPTKKPLPLSDELQWAAQAVWGNNTLLLRNHIESLSDPEAIAFTGILAARIAADILSGDIATASLGVYAGLSMATGRVAGLLYEMPVVTGRHGDASSAKAPMAFSIADGSLRIRIKRPEVVNDNYLGR